MVKIKSLSKILIMSSLIFLSACSQKGEEDNPTGGGGPALPDVSFVGASPVTRVASNEPLFLESSVILDELDNPIGDNYEFTISGEPTGIEGFPIEVSTDGLTFQETIKVYSKLGKISFYAKVPTKKTTNLPTPYRITARPTKGNVLGRFFISVVPGPVAIVGQFKGTTFEDEFPYNNKKDPNENYTIRGDGNTIVNVKVGPVLDAFANKVDTATIRLAIDDGTIVSPNPSTVGIEGDASFSIQSTVGTGIISMLAEAIDNNNQVLGTAVGTLHKVRPHLSVQENGLFGNVFINQTITKTFIVENIGNTSATNVTFAAGPPFSVSGGTCVNGIRLRPGDQCSVQVSFTGGISGLFEADLRIIGSPLDIQEATVIKPLVATAVKNALLAAPDAAIVVPQQTCGIAADYITYVRNDGDLPGLNFRPITPTLNSNGLPKDTEIILPPADANPSPNLDDIINCGNVLLPNRKCRIIIRHTPTALYETQILTGGVEIDGQAPVNMTIRVSSKVGNPHGTIPVQTTTITGQPDTQMEMNESDQVSVKVGPIVDACGNLLNNIPVNAQVSGGTLSSSSLNSSFGFATFTWYSSSDINKVGQQFVNISSGTSVGAAAVNFQGIKIVGIDPNGPNIGQILRVNYIPPKYLFYSVRNDGVIPATNMSSDVDNNGDGWMARDTSYAGGCEDNRLNPGETCTYRFVLNPLGMPVGNLLAKITIGSTESGINTVEFNTSANSVNAPTINFTGAPNINMGTFSAGSRPEQVITLNNTSTNASVLGLNVSVAAPFEKIATTCSSTLPPNSSCTLTIKLPIDVRGTYNTTIQATSEFSSASVGVAATIVSNLASGTIPMTVDKTSVPANPTNPSAFITVNLGPIKDAYGNNVVAGTVVNLVATKGQMSVDTDNDGFATINTGSGANEGRATFTIRARSISEISNFTITASVVNNSTTIASGNIGGAFTGAILEFTENSKDFGQVAVGALEFQTIRLRNNGNEAATNITWNTSSTDFSLAGQGGCTSLAAGASCDVTVLVNPVQPGSLSATVNINASGNGIISDTINVTATAVEAAKLVAGNGTYDSNLKDFPDKTLNINYIPGSTASTTFKVRNIGQENLVDFFTQISIRSTEFNLSAPASCNTLGFNQECTITVTFNPTSLLPPSLSGEITITGESPSRLTIAKVNVNLTSPQLAFTLKQATLPRNACGAYQIQLQDSNEVGTPVATNVSFNLTRSGGTGSFFSNSGCTTTITSININAGQSSSAVFYYRGTTDGDHTLTAANISKSVQTLTQVYTAPQISPSSITVAPNESVNFSTNNGVNPFSYQVVTPNGGTIGSSNGNYTAPVSAGTYIIRVTDNIGNTSDATVTVENLKLTTGRHYMCYLSVGTINCIGENSFGQYGVNIARKGSFNEAIPVGKYNTINYSTLGSAVKNIFGGGYNMCVTNQSNRLYCQGANHLGTVGDSTLNDRTTATAVTGTFTTLDSSKAVSVSWGLHTCAINSSNQLYCWGKNDRGQVGKNNSTISYASPQQVTIVGANDFTQVAAGLNFTCALRSNGQVVCFGDNAFGQLGDTTTTSQIGSGVTVFPTSGSGALSNIREISAGKYHMCAVDNSNQLYCWGRNHMGQIGNNTTTNSSRPILITTDVRSVHSGGSHTCLVKNSTGQVQCWGNNLQGQLGQGNINNTYRIPTSLSGISGTITGISLGENFTCLIHNGNQIKCSGENAYGVMGTNNLNDVTTASIVSPGGGNISCMSGGNYNSSQFTCTCSSSSNLYGYESKSCSAASLTNLTGTSLQYGHVGTAFTFGFAPKQASLFYSNVPVNFSRTGTGVISYIRIITDNDAEVAYPNYHNNLYTRGSNNTETVTASIGSVSQSVNYRLYQLSCDDYLNVYGDLTSGAQTIVSSGTTTYSGYCLFYPTFAYTYDVLADYTRQYKQKTNSYATNQTISCPPNTEVVWQSGELTDGVTSCFYSYEDLLRTGFLLDNSICAPLPAGSAQGTAQWNCR